jgi:ubiquinone/menaquinone biosynthesis C-methylase UbiE
LREHQKHNLVLCEIRFVLLQAGKREAVDDRDLGSAEILPFESRTFDTVVTTWTLCTIPDVLAALREMRRVLRPDGRMVFVEHGQVPERGVARW